MVGGRGVHCLVGRGGCGGPARGLLAALGAGLCEGKGANMATWEDSTSLTPRHGPHYFAHGPKEGGGGG